ncbi:hypothetical protein [Rhodococcus sp. WAY2]|uniref:hypothetical protein n=1 Tax=Rhodococcus sp. WAY2 TaxID=2663121 RepID=UPI00135C7556|nr:hypothetical protein [Rhodococcus sp. WAY2]
MSERGIELMTTASRQLDEMADVVASLSGRICASRVPTTVPETPSARSLYTWPRAITSWAGSCRPPGMARADGRREMVVGTPMATSVPSRPPLRRRFWIG